MGFLPIRVGLLDLSDGLLFFPNLVSYLQIITDYLAQLRLSFEVSVVPGD